MINCQTGWWVESKHHCRAANVPDCDFQRFPAAQASEEETANTAMAAEADSPAKPPRATTAAHRMIELQSPEDLSFLVANVRRAAAESIAAAFPPVDGAGAPDAKDDLHASIERLVDEVRACRVYHSTTLDLLTHTRPRPLGVVCQPDLHPGRAGPEHQRPADRRRGGVPGPGGGRPLDGRRAETGRRDGRRGRGVRAV